MRISIFGDSIIGSVEGDDKGGLAQALQPELKARGISYHTKGFSGSALPQWLGPRGNVQARGWGAAKIPPADLYITTFMTNDQRNNTAPSTFAQQAALLAELLPTPSAPLWWVEPNRDIPEAAAWRADALAALESVHPRIRVWRRSPVMDDPNVNAVHPSRMAHLENLRAIGLLDALDNIERGGLAGSLSTQGPLAHALANIKTQGRRAATAIKKNPLLLLPPAALAAKLKGWI